MSVDIQIVDKIVAEHGNEKKSVIPVLQAIQKVYNYLPEEALLRVSDISEITPADITSVASFYHQFRLQPVGEHMVKICVGTACHVKGANQVYDAFKRKFNLNDNEYTDASGKYTLEKVSCLGCCTLAPVVQIDEVTYGHVTTKQVDQIITDFETQKDTKTRKQYRKHDGAQIEGEVRIGLGSCCVASGSDEIWKAVDETIGRNRLPLKMKHVGCIGMCHHVPLLEVVPVKGDPVLYSKVKADNVKDILSKHFRPNGWLNRIKSQLMNTVEYLQTDAGWDGIERYSINMREKQVSLFLGNQIPIATEYRGILNPVDIVEYKERGGFLAVKKALLEMTPDEVINEIIDSGIRGRGGAGFPTGMKWKVAANQVSGKKYLICNGDEGDPGAFMDRMLLESYPYRVIEGMVIGAYAVGANNGYFYIRAEYPLAVQRIRDAILQCEKNNLLGDNILGSGFSFSVSIYEGAGAFVCGEETALIASIEGRRGNPAIRPPYPAESGLWGHPTLVNNTETFAQIPYIISEGAGKFNSIGTEKSKGTKVFALAGKIARGGLIEVPMGITIGEIVYEIGGGIANGRQFKAVQVGGPSGGCIPARLDKTPVDFESLTKLGAMMGSGGLVVLDDTDCMVDIARYFLSFTQAESCGKCTFCRIGTRRMLDILNNLTQGKAKPGDLEELEKLAENTRKGSLCGLGKTAPNPVFSTLKYFREEYQAHLNGVCPTGKCTALITYSVNENCIGCTLCSQQCPVNAIPFTPHEKHIISAQLCIKCNGCRIVCPSGAIDVN